MVELLQSKPTTLNVSLLSEIGNTESLHSLVGLGSTLAAAAVALPRYGNPNFQQGVIKC